MHNQSKKMLSPAQCRAARALLGWTQRELSAAIKAGPKTVSDYEISDLEGSGRADNTRTLRASTLERLRTALEDAGIIFIEEDDQGEGVRFREPEGSRQD